MSTPDDPGFGMELETLLHFTERFDAAQKADPTLQGAELTDLIRIVPGRQAVIAGRFRGLPAIFRIFEDPANPAAAREWAELHRVRPLMQNPPFQVVRPLHFAPDHGIQVIEKVDGTPLLKHLWSLPQRARLPLLPQAAAWLHCYSTPTIAPARANPYHWLQRAETQSATQPFPQLRRIETAILARMKRLAHQIDGQNWRIAINHGDFHPNNLIVTAAGLTGIDTGSPHSAPIYRDMARFMLHIARRGLTLSHAHHLGVDKALFDAFCAAFTLNETEQGLILPFFLGFDALARVETAALPCRRIKRAGQVYERLLEDLRKIADEP